MSKYIAIWLGTSPALGAPFVGFVYGLLMLWHQETNLYDQGTFYDAFIKDLAHAK